MFDIDHISRDRLDNRKQNLRLCTHQENTFNQKMRVTNSTGLIGVSFMKMPGHMNLIFIIMERNIILDYLKIRKRQQ